METGEILEEPTFYGKDISLNEEIAQVLRTYV